MSDHKGHAKFEVLRQAPRRAMAIGAHPDDVELGAGGTLAAWARRGCAVTLVVCTGGGAGGWEEGGQRCDVEGVREREQHAAAERLGVHKLLLLGLADGGLEDNSELRGTLVRLIRQHQPEVVFSHDPATRDRFLHRDHRILGQVVQDAIYPFARDRLHYPEHLHIGLQPHRCERLLLWDTDEPNAVADVSQTVAIQAAALSEHRSQLLGLFGGQEPATWLRARSHDAAAGFPFSDGERFRMLRAPA